MNDGRRRFGPRLAGFGVAIALAAAATGQDRTFTFDEDVDGWVSRVRDRVSASVDWVADGGRNGSGALRVHAASDLSRRRWEAAYILDDPPTGEALRLTAWVRGENVTHGFELVAESIREGDDRIPHETLVIATTPPASGIFDWTKLETLLVVPHAAGRVEVRVSLDGPGDVVVDDVRIERVRRSLPPAPGLVRVRHTVTVEARVYAPTGQVRVPLPVTVPGASAPIAFRLDAEPADAASLVRVAPDDAGHPVAHVSLANVSSTRPVTLRLVTIVLAGPTAFAEAGKTPGPDWAKTALPWLPTLAWTRDAGPANAITLTRGRTEIDAWRHVVADDERWKRALRIAADQWDGWLRSRPTIGAPTRPLTNGVGIASIDESELERITAAIEQ